jgi:hypothetical protein
MQLAGRWGQAGVCDEDVLRLPGHAGVVLVGQRTYRVKRDIEGDPRYPPPVRTLPPLHEVAAYYPAIGQQYVNPRKGLVHMFDITRGLGASPG